MSAKFAVSLFGSVLVIAVVAGFLSIKMRPAPSPVPTEIAQAETPKVLLSDIHSIYGDMNLNISETTQSTGNKIYKVTVSPLTKEGETITIYENAYPAGSKLTLSPNAWSPDNTYLLMKEATGSSSSYLVFRANGENFASGDKYINASEVYKQKAPDFTLKEVTGWASDTLLQAIGEDEGGKLVKFWIEIPSTAVIRLAHR